MALPQTINQNPAQLLQNIRAALQDGGALVKALSQAPRWLKGVQERANAENPNITELQKYIDFALLSSFSGPKGEKAPTLQNLLLLGGQNSSSGSTNVVFQEPNPILQNPTSSNQGSWESLNGQLIKVIKTPSVDTNPQTLADSVVLLSFAADRIRREAQQKFGEILSSTGSNPTSTRGSSSQTPVDQLRAHLGVSTQEEGKKWNGQSYQPNGIPLELPKIDSLLPVLNLSDQATLGKVKTAVETNISKLSAAISQLDRIKQNPSTLEQKTLSGIYKNILDAYLTLAELSRRTILTPKNSSSTSDKGRFNILEIDPFSETTRAILPNSLVQLLPEFVAKFVPEEDFRFVSSDEIDSLSAFYKPKLTPSSSTPKDQKLKAEAARKQAETELTEQLARIFLRNDSKLQTEWNQFKTGKTEPSLIVFKNFIESKTAPKTDSATVKSVNIESASSVTPKFVLSDEQERKLREIIERKPVSLASPVNGGGRFGLLEIDGLSHDAKGFFGEKLSELIEKRTAQMGGSGSESLNDIESILKVFGPSLKIGAITPTEKAEKQNLERRMFEAIVQVLFKDKPTLINQWQQSIQSSDDWKNRLSNFLNSLPEGWHQSGSTTSPAPATPVLQSVVPVVAPVVVQSLPAPAQTTQTSQPGTRVGLNDVAAVLANPQSLAGTVVEEPRGAETPWERLQRVYPLPQIPQEILIARMQSFLSQPKIEWEGVDIERYAFRIEQLFEKGFDNTTPQEEEELLKKLFIYKLATLLAKHPNVPNLIEPLRKMISSIGWDSFSNRLSTLTFLNQFVQNADLKSSIKNLITEIRNGYRGSNNEVFAYANYLVLLSLFADDHFINFDLVGFDSQGSITLQSTNTLPPKQDKDTDEAFVIAILHKLNVSKITRDNAWKTISFSFSKKSYEVDAEVYSLLFEWFPNEMKQVIKDHKLQNYLESKKDKFSYQIRQNPKSASTLYPFLKEFAPQAWSNIAVYTILSNRNPDSDFLPGVGELLLQIESPDLLKELLAVGKKTNPNFNREHETYWRATFHLSIEWIERRLKELEPQRK